MKKSQMKMDAAGFNRMMATLKKKTGASYEDVLKAMTGEIVSLAAKKTKKTTAKSVTKSVTDSLATRFVSSAGDKVRKAKDGSLIFKQQGMQAGKWIRLRKDYFLSPIGKKNPAGQTLAPKTQARVNRALKELRDKQKTILQVKKARIASSQGSFLYMLKKLRIPVTASGLGPAQKAEMVEAHKRVIGAKLLKNDIEASIVLKSKSESGLNNNSKGIGAFRAAFNGKTKEFLKAVEKDLATYVKKFATRNGFSAR
jgi:hypothetical protein